MDRRGVVARVGGRPRGVDVDEISSVSRVQSTTDGGVVVAVNLRVGLGELPHQVVLIGTPRG